MRTKSLLLCSASAIATAAAATGPAQAQVLDPGPNGYTYNVGGGLLFSPAEMSLAGLEEDKMGSGYDTDLDDFYDHFGGTAFFSVTKKIDNTWDVGFGKKINKLLDSSGSLTWSGSGFGSGYYVSGYSQGRTAFGFASMDFEVGYTPVLAENRSVRLFAGIRGLYFTSNSEFSSGFSISGSGFGFGSGYVSFAGTDNMTTKFIGAGPRIGISGAHRFEGSKFGLSGTVAGALLFGQQTTTWSGSFSGYASSGIGSGSSFAGSSYSSSFTTQKLVLDLEAKAGVDYYLDDSTALTIGYRGELLKNVGPYDDHNEHRLVHGPFLSLSGSLP